MTPPGIAARLATKSGCSPAGTKQISWLSFFSATRNPSRRASSRTAALSSAPTGKRARQLRLRQREQKIRLILLAVDASLQPVALRRRIEVDLRVVPRRDGL